MVEVSTGEAHDVGTFENYDGFMWRPDGKAVLIDVETLSLRPTGLSTKGIWMWDSAGDIVAVYTGKSIVVYKIDTE
jgi:hypothetical protein